MYTVWIAWFRPVVSRASAQRLKFVPPLLPTLASMTYENYLVQADRTKKWSVLLLRSARPAR